MRRTILTLATLVGMTGICATAAQAGTSLAIAGGLTSQTLARHGHHGRHGGYHGGYHGYRHHGYRHHGYRHHGYRHHPAIYYVPGPRVHYAPYNSFYYSGPGFSFGFGY